MSKYSDKLKRRADAARNAAVDAPQAHADTPTVSRAVSQPNAYEVRFSRHRATAADCAHILEGALAIINAQIDKVVAMKEDATGNDKKEMQAVKGRLNASRDRIASAIAHLRHFDSPIAGRAVSAETAKSTPPTVVHGARA